MFLVFALLADVAGANFDSKQVTVGGFQCDGIQTATVYYPTDTSKKYPLLSFAHGWTEGGNHVGVNYKDVLETVASAGYVVIAEHSGLTNVCWEAEKHDQIRAIDYVNETSEFASRVDWHSKIGLYGHSMGGSATRQNAADATIVEKYNLGAAVLFHPGYGGVKDPTKIPSFYATGSADNIVRPTTVKSSYDKAAAPKVFAEMTNANHFECQSSENGFPCPHGWTGYAINWMNCYLKNSQADCDTAFNVCKQTAVKMSQCLTDKGDASVIV